VKRRGHHRGRVFGRRRDELVVSEPETVSG
jgi:hypothetical protein